MIQNPHEFLPIAYRAAAQVAQCRLLAEEAGERAFHLFTLALLQGCPPEHPKAWLRSVARRCALALLRSDWAKQKSLEQADQVPYQEPARAGSAAGVDFVRERLQSSLSLSRRQKQALEAAVTCNTTRAAARSCGMKPRDFRRSLSSISRKAREMFAARSPLDSDIDHPAIPWPPES